MIHYWAGAFIMFSVTWWLAFFMALPVGVRMAEQPEDGHAPGAPENPHLWKKALAATLVALAATWGIMHMIETGRISFRPPSADSAL